MNDIDEIMKIYQGFEPKKYELIRQYVNKFKEPWPVFGPQDPELIKYYLKFDKLEDVPEDDPFIAKYYQDDSDRPILY